MDAQTQGKTEYRDRASELITSGRISSAVWFVAWPTVINTLIHLAYNLINRAFLGHMPGDTSPALAALGIGQVVLMVQQSVMFGISAGASALTSRFLGAQENRDGEEATRQSLILAVIVGLASAAPLMLFSVPIARAAGAKPEVVQLAADYMRIIGYFSVPMFLHWTIVGALRSAGDARSPLYAGAVIVVLNIVLDWLLIFGIGAFPRLGVRGAAIATGLSRLVGMAIIVWFLRRSVLGASLSRFRPHLQWFGRIMRIGWPAAVQNLLWSTAFVAYVKVLAFLPDATVCQAALTVAITIESVAFMPGAAYSIAATPLVGQNLGAGNPKRAERSAWTATWHAVGIMTVVAVLFLAIPRQLAHLFTPDEPVVRHIVSYLRINGVCEPFLAVAMVLTGALQGAGDTLFPMLVEALTSWVIRLPLSWLLAVTLGYGAVGAWIAMSVTTFLYGILMAAWFKAGRWRTAKV